MRDSVITELHCTPSQFTNDNIRLTSFLYQSEMKTFPDCLQLMVAVAAATA